MLVVVNIFIKHLNAYSHIEYILYFKLTTFVNTLVSLGFLRGSFLCKEVLSIEY